MLQFEVILSVVNFIKTHFTKIPDKIKLSLMSEIALKNIFAHYCGSAIAVGNFVLWEFLFAQSHWSKKIERRHYSCFFLIIFEKIYDRSLSTIISKIFETMWWNRAENVNICFCVIFEPYCKSFISWAETVYWAVYPLTFEIVLKFLNFIRSSLKSFSNLWGNTHRMFFIINIKYRFTYGDSIFFKKVAKFQIILSRIADSSFLVLSSFEKFLLMYPVTVPVFLTYIARDVSIVYIKRL